MLECFRILDSSFRLQVDDFNDANSNVRVLCLSMLAGGVGLNLCGANHMFIIDMHWCVEPVANSGYGLLCRVQESVERTTGVRSYTSYGTDEGGSSAQISRQRHD